ncbi:TauD/TfdA family dioxygenase [Sphingomonas sp. 1P06PA]|uniref:TauD/TfdA dioxygenase family protein n=1 Tax=Sphingomonas sp. 1P06PA TaxID=554121 RepID=UPI0039A41B52
MTIATATLSARFATRPLTPNLGVEVSGFTFSVDPHADDIAEIRALADQHLVVLFRDQTLAEDAQVAVSQALGTVIPPVEEAFTSTSNPLILRLGNVDMEGNKLAPDDPGTMFTYAPERWHSDGSYKPIPNYLTMLHALEIPPEGGETWFSSMAAAYKALPEETRRKIDGREMEHPYPNSGKAVKGWTGRAIEVVRHPLVRQIPGGDKALFLSPFGGRIIGMDPEESDALVKELFDFATSGAFSYHHQWRLGDTLMWNNRGLVHTARPWDRVHHRRLLQRTELSDAGGYRQ